MDYKIKTKNISKYWSS